MGPGACPAELDEVRTLAVPEPVRPLCIDGNWASACREPPNGTCKLLRSLHDRGQTVGGLGEVRDIRM